MVQWLRFRASTVGCVGLIPGQGTKTPDVTRYVQKLKKKKVHEVQMNLAFKEWEEDGI